ncbi:MAG: hypothetical protein WC055_02230 [Melioribacteraceae bacterium]
MMRKKYKKTISLSTLDKVWNDWVEFAIIRPMIKFGRVKVDDKFSMEIVGKKIISDARIVALMSAGVVVSKRGYKIEPKKFGNNRPGLIYKITCEDKNYKTGQLIFEPDRKLSKRVSEHLKNSQQYYRICQ